jgi:hypothetical protein
MAGSDSLRAGTAPVNRSNPLNVPLWCDWKRKPRQSITTAGLPAFQGDRGYVTASTTLSPGIQPPDATVIPFPAVLLAKL